jgi:hypothetical protein
VFFYVFFLRTDIFLFFLVASLVFVSSGRAAHGFTSTWKSCHRLSPRPRSTAGSEGQTNSESLCYGSSPTGPLAGIKVLKHSEATFEIKYTLLIVLYIFSIAPVNDESHLIFRCSMVWNHPWTVGLNSLNVENWKLNILTSCQMWSPPSQGASPAADFAWSCSASWPKKNRFPLNMCDYHRLSQKLPPILIIFR